MRPDYLPHVRTDSPVFRVVDCVSLPKVIWVNDAPWVSWSGIENWDTYYRGVSRTYRSGLNRKRRRLVEIGNLSFEI